MLFRYLADRISWILFYLLSLLFVDLLVWLDNGIAIRADSLLYLNMLLLFSMIIFLIWRFRKETSYVISLDKLADEIADDWMDGLPAARFHADAANHRLLMAVGNLHRQKFADNLGAQVVEQEYTAAWVHEVKAPLTAMKLTIEANRGEPVIRTIETEWLRIYLLVDQQLYISRLPSLEADFILEKAGIQQLVANEVREVASWCMEKNIAVEFEGEEAYVSTDRKWCRFVIRQLLTNAIKYSPEGAMILMTMSVTPEGYVCLTMQDEGPGIAKHDLPRIFDKGFTGDNGRLQNAATGLGLYLARTVGGKIGIHLVARSEAHKGTEMDMIFTARNTFEDVQAQ
ncbi:sensor histidine kinase [Paenibacillus pabuli]|uniref:sensor histidine kinase n=1 Tax=Paenibacillus pabuli TaxID=1472 RepID=UPI001FFEDF3C|nr:sensor histidine kinase [Paenibacillus pabuli]UPK41542.1 sensor histidine kinase [Paenibacillus pabuli]